MEIYTIQMAQWRKAVNQEVALVDTTVKSGIDAFAPRWDMVMGSKDGSLSEADYRQQYIDLMRESWYNRRLEWEKLLQMDKVALACYCKAGNFCHRHILKEIVMKIQEQRGVVVIDQGELV